MNVVAFIFAHFSYKYFDLSIILYSLICTFPHLRVKQVQEKKVKKISEMNIDLSKSMGNGCIASSSNSSSSRPYLANGGSPDRSYNYISNDFSFPPGGIPSLRLPMVVVSNPFTCNSFSVFVRQGKVFYDMTFTINNQKDY